MPKSKFYYDFLNEEMIKLINEKVKEDSRPASELARVFEVHRSNVSRLLHGTYNISYKQLSIIAKWLQTTVCALDEVAQDRVRARIKGMKVKTETPTTTD